ncbi:uncharacterized protein LOC101846038 isoform X2 [Aplysia californica]|nr:uncharacterized protein LOC101846038 isoform X2 [Aplysia californica]
MMPLSHSQNMDGFGFGDMAAFSHRGLTQKRKVPGDVNDKTALCEAEMLTAPSKRVCVWPPENGDHQFEVQTQLEGLPGCLKDMPPPLMSAQSAAFPSSEVPPLSAWMMSSQHGLSQSPSIPIPGDKVNGDLPRGFLSRTQAAEVNKRNHHHHHYAGSAHHNGVLGGVCSVPGDIEPSGMDEMQMEEEVEDGKGCDNSMNTSHGFTSPWVSNTSSSIIINNNNNNNLGSSAHQELSVSDAVAMSTNVLASGVQTSSMEMESLPLSTDARRQEAERTSLKSQTPESGKCSYMTCSGLRPSPVSGRMHCHCYASWRGMYGIDHGYITDYY